MKQVDNVVQSKTAILSTCNADYPCNLHALEKHIACSIALKLFSHGAFCVKQVSQCQMIPNCRWHSLSCTLEQSAKKPCTPSFLWSCQVRPTTTLYQLLLAAEHD